MQLLDLTLDSPVENLALDEALLDSAEQPLEALSDGGPDELLRIWEPRTLMVVAGSSTRLADEAYLDACRHHGVPVLRRASGGTTILTGPGCLMYAVILNHEQRAELRSIDRAHEFVLGTIAAALQEIIQPRPASPSTALCTPPTIIRAGISDLALGEKKFSGNSLRFKRRHLLYHGTLLYQFPLSVMSRFLKMPSRQPAYRAGRTHDEFLTNFPADAVVLRKALAAAFAAEQHNDNWPRELTARLAEEKYSRSNWTERL